MSKKSSNIRRTLEKYAISNITLYLIACYMVGYIIIFSGHQDFMYNYLTLEPYFILRGQIWRLFTWIVIPPSVSNLFFVLIMLYFYYSIGRTLENMWGTFSLNVYLFSGMLFTIIGSFICYFISYAVTMNPAGMAFGWQFSTFYINMSLFLAYAATFPEMRVYIFFILPIKVKVLGIIYAVILILECIGGNIIDWVVIGSSLLNFIVFFVMTRRRMRLSPKMARQRVVYKQAMRNAENKVAQASAVTRHKCSVCGKTESSDPELEFRFCSKCNGNYEYCRDHLFTHTHVQ